jgi:hypothetical protein
VGHAHKLRSDYWIALRRMVPAQARRVGVSLIL